jgi:hypothetical protein
LTTASQILTRAGQAIRYIGRGEVLAAADANDALICFNAMLDSWSNENLLSYVVLERSFALQASKASYTIGSGGDINVVRPLDIPEMYVQDSSGNNFNIQMRPRDWWNQIGNRGPTITSQIPSDAFYDPQYPLGVLNIFPTPLIGYTVFYDSTQQQVDPASLTTSISMPEGYEHAYVLNLALQLISSGFPCMLDDKDYNRLVANAAEAKGNVKRTNIKDVIASYDPILVSRGTPTYNIYRDNTNT